MIIKLEIPDSFHDQRLTLIAGNRELVARKNPWENFWEVKVVRCSNCGECCLGLVGGQFKNFPFPIDDEGRCSKLVQEGERLMCRNTGHDLPFRCLTDPALENVPCCSIRHTKQIIQDDD